MCRTDLHVAEGDLCGCTGPGRRGTRSWGGGCDQAGSRGFTVGRSESRGCVTPAAVRLLSARRREPLSRFALRGLGRADGGYAEFATVPADFAHRLPAGYTDGELALPLCAGIIGYRALLRAQLPPGGRLGMVTGSAVARTSPPRWRWPRAGVHVMTRGADARGPRDGLGPPRCRAPPDPIPVPTGRRDPVRPVGDLVLLRFAALDRGGTLAIAGIHLSDIPRLNYQRHLFQERKSGRSPRTPATPGVPGFAGRHRIG